MTDAIPLFCEKLIPIVHHSKDYWWRYLTDDLDEPPFDAGGRIHAVLEADALHAIGQARRQGFRPILLCSDLDDRSTLVKRLQAAHEPAQILDFDTDSDLMRYLLAHPSRELIQGWLKLRPVLWPEGGFRQALDDWMAHDPVATELARRLREGELRLEDCRWLADSAEDEEAPALPRRLDFEWGLDPEHRLQVHLDAPGRARVLHQFRGQAGAADLRLGERRLALDIRGEAQLEPADLRWLAEHLGLDLDRATPTPEATFAPKRLLEFLDRLCGRVLARPRQWTEAFDSHHQELFSRFAHATTRRVRHPGTDAPPQPYLEWQPGDGLAFTLTWDPAAGRYRPPAAPRVVVTLDGQPLEAHPAWSGDLARLELPGRAPPPDFRYGWDWDPATQCLTLEIATG